MTLDRRIPLLGIGIGAILVAYALFATESEEERMRAVLTNLEQAVAVSEPENELQRMARINKAFGEIFTEDVRVQIPELSRMASGRKALALLAAHAGAHFATLDISFDSLDFSFAENETTGRVTSEVTLVATRAQDVERDERRVALGFIEQDGEWRIDSVGVLDEDGSSAE